jgi:predicted MPP superfamily phosphohydrolase
MMTKFLFFAFLGLSLLFGAHFLLYYTGVHFFGVTSPKTRGIILATLAFLSVSFFLISILSHYQENFFSITLYALSGFWLGLLANLFLVSLLLWIFHPIVIRWNAPLTASTFFLIAFLFSLYGTWVAYHPVVKNISVPIANLPESWQSKKIVQISDIHLGHLYRADFAQRLANQINAQNPDVVFITGDLFDGMDGNLLDFVKPLGEIKAKQGIFFITGNHETYLGVEKTLAILKQTKINILNDQITDIDGLQVIGYSYPPREEMGENTKNFSATITHMTGFVKGKPTILLHHAPINIEEAKNLKVNLQLSGHTHKGQLFPFNFITHLIYKGYDYGLKTEGQYSIYTTNGIGTWGPPMRTFNTPEIVVITPTKL